MPVFTAYHLLQHLQRQPTAKPLGVAARVSASVIPPTPSLAHSYSAWGGRLQPVRFAFSTRDGAYSVVTLAYNGAL